MGMDQEEMFWKEMALYLLDCQSATAERALELKSTPACERRRHIAICEAMLKAMRVRVPTWRTRDESHVEDRVLGVLARSKG